MHVNTLLISAAKNSNTMGIVSAFYLSPVPKVILTPYPLTQVQDSLLACYLMTAQNSFIEKARFFDLIFSGIGDEWDGVIPTPAILKPRPLWTGKQLLSMILPDISLNAYEPADMNDEKVCIRRGYICTGRFNKKVIGKEVERGLIHRMVLQEGRDVTSTFMSHIQFIANDWMTQHSFSTGIQDCCIAQEVFKKVRQKVYNTMDECTDVKMPEEKATMKLNRVRDIAAKFVLDTLPSDHGMMNMIKSGSKGSNINIAQITAAVGQQMVNGKRIPCGNNNRTSAHYSQYSPDPVGRGFVCNSYMTGLSPKEFFTHAQGGREGLIDTACVSVVVFAFLHSVTNILFVYTENC